MKITLPSAELCARCKGRGYCGKPCPLLAKLRAGMPKPKLAFSGATPPEIFVGRHNYPYVYAGILAPETYEDTSEYSMPEKWHEKRLSIKEILALRGELVYSRFRLNIKSVRSGWRNKATRLLSVMQETAMASKPTMAEFRLRRPPAKRFLLESHVPIIGNPAPLIKARLEENPHVERKVEYLVNDTDAKASEAIEELYRARIEVSNIIKVLSAGLLGTKTRRKLVPTRWAVTAVDDTLSKKMLEEIRYYDEISEFMLFHAEYLGNHYEFLLLPDKFAFEVLEAKMPGSVWNPSMKLVVMQDYEGFHGRKSYASNVTGAYYANRLALCEYLMRVKRQASCLVMRECRPEYYAPCGVGILREASRQAFRNKPERFSNLHNALEAANQRLRLPVEEFTKRSWLLKNFGKQQKLDRWLKT